ncbi:hypothetical protein J6590_018993 [Homalodisca vitripennis]|nr:hypothetical protein J6590_018993 [Homalodisca vitripennis]
MLALSDEVRLQYKTVSTTKDGYCRIDVIIICLKLLYYPTVVRRGTFAVQDSIYDQGWILSDRCDNNMFEAIILSYSCQTSYYTILQLSDEVRLQYKTVSTTKDGYCRIDVIIICFKLLYYPTVVRRGTFAVQDSMYAQGWILSDRCDNNLFEAIILSYSCQTVRSSYYTILQLSDEVRLQYKTVSTTKDGYCRIDVIIICLKLLYYPTVVRRGTFAVQDSIYDQGWILSDRCDNNLFEAIILSYSCQTRNDFVFLEELRAIQLGTGTGHCKHFRVTRITLASLAQLAAAELYTHLAKANSPKYSVIANMMATLCCHPTTILSHHHTPRVESQLPGRARPTLAAARTPPSPLTPPPTASLQWTIHIHLQIVALFKN